MALQLSRPSLRHLRPSTSHPTTPRILTTHQTRPHSHNPQAAPKITPLAPSTSQKLLAAQRLNRPLSPHLSIYKWQITSVLSALERLTGQLLAGGLYLFGAAYVAAPYLSWDVSAAALAAAFGALPLLAKVGAKFAVALPFVFHCANGVRNLVWSTARFLGIRQVVRSGWFTVGVAVLGAGGLAWFV